MNAETHLVEGILVRGGTDFRKVTLYGALNCVRTVYAGSAEGGEDVTRSIYFSRYAP